MARPITDTLRILQGGAFLDECSDMLADVVKSVDETGKAGNRHNLGAQHACNE